MKIEIASLGFSMNIYAISAVINLIISVLVGGIIWRRAQNRELADVFGLFSITLAIWSFGYIFWQLSPTPTQAIFWSRFLMMGAIFVTITFFHFTLVFLDKLKEFRNILYAGYVLMLLFAVSNYTDLFVSGVKEVLSFPFWPQPGVLFHPFLTIWTFYAVLALYLLYQAYYSSKRKIRTQIWYLFAAITITYIGGGINYFLWYGIELPPISTVSVSFFQILVGYAVAKHQLFNTKVIFTEFFSWLLMSVLTVNIFLSSTITQLIKNFAILTFVGICIYFFVKSVYREVEAREEAEELTEKLKDMNEQKSKMLSIASHQFRSPLTSIEGYASLIQEGSYGEVPDRLRKPVNRITTSSKKLSRIVNDFLNISRVEDGRMKYNFKVADVKNIVREVVEEAESTATGKDLDLSFHPDDSGTYPAKVDIGKLQQVVTNLVDNAIKYTETGSVEVQLRQEGEHILIEVEDTGIGIDPEDADIIFDQFSRADEAKDINVVGSGLGLYIAKQIIEAHDGEIWATSPGKGEGSTFHVKLATADKTNLDSKGGESEPDRKDR